MIPATQIWNFSTLLSAFSKPSSSLSVPVSAFGEPSTCWKATETTTPAQKSQGMKQLMAGGGVALIGVILVPLLSGLFG